MSKMRYPKATATVEKIKKAEKKPKPSPANQEYNDSIKAMEEGRRQHRRKQSPAYKDAIKKMNQGRKDYRAKQKKG